jgi:hypothetical protein
MNLHLKKTRQLTCIALILTTIFTALYYMPKASASMAIITVDPQTAKVGTLVSITANVTTNNGTYAIFFDDQLVGNGTAAQQYAITNFTVPDAKFGAHYITIKDVATGENATKLFSVSTDYNINVSGPERIQEGTSMPIIVNMTGGDTTATQTANVTVIAPTGISYTKNVEIPLTVTGNGTKTLNYPTDFSTDANTSFVGQYIILFNTTFATKTFNAGLTDAAEYHRNQTVNIKAVYEPNENVTLTIVGSGINYLTVNVTDLTGIVNYNWTVPINAPMGSYQVTATSTSGFTTKTPADNQNFTLPGYPINFTAQNLAGEPVQSILVRGYEGAKLITYAITTSDGKAVLNLEIGNFSIRAYYNSQTLVSEQTITVTNTTATTITCNLTNIRIQVASLVNSAQINIPEAGILLLQDNSTYATDINGTAIIHSLPPNTTYSMNLTRYGAVFNTTTIANLLVNNEPTGWYDIIVNCPTSNLQVNVTKANGQTFDNAIVTAQELLGAPHYEGTTNQDGIVTFNPVFGKYRIQVLDPNRILLNETNIDLFTNQNTTVSCQLYGLTVSIQVVDYFGQGISNVNVKLQGEKQQVLSLLTQGDGTATFTNIIGGSLQATLYMSGSSDPAEALSFSALNSTTVQIKLAKYVTLAGMLIETNQLAIIAMIIIAALLVVVMEIRRRMRIKTTKNETVSSDK